MSNHYDEDYNWINRPVNKCIQDIDIWTEDLRKKEEEIQKLTHDLKYEIYSLRSNILHERVVYDKLIEVYKQNMLEFIKIIAAEIRLFLDNIINSIKHTGDRNNINLYTAEYITTILKDSESYLLRNVTDITNKDTKNHIDTVKKYLEILELYDKAKDEIEMIETQITKG